MKRREFTDQELKEMGQLTLDLITQAIESGDLKKAKGLSKRMYQEFMFMHDLYRDWLTALMTHSYEVHGEEDLYLAMNKAVATYLRGSVEIKKKSGFRQYVEMLLAGVRGHGQPIEISEDDEKIVVKGAKCTGQVLLKNGSYGPPCNFTLIQNPHDLTFNMKDFPIYCCHAPIQEQLSIDWMGEPVYVSIPSEKMAAEPCQCLIYKNRKDVPEQVYTRVGRKKPKS